MSPMKLAIGAALLALAVGAVLKVRNTQAQNGEQAIAYLAGTGAFTYRASHPLPALVLLDINMPKKSGLEVLEWIRLQPQFKSLPVLMLTSSLRQEDMDLARQLGTDDYLLKVSHPSKLSEIVKSLHERWLSQPTPAH